ncbi:MAG: prolipoprotein diacylglyceryl transferase [Pseudonocardiales bacterium]|nr:prolipoprotein diacylglyceryl transferase [Pseudonocardiales bacterium]
MRFTGRRTGAADPPAPGDTFDVVDTIAHVIPGSGTVSLTRRIEGIAVGDWTVHAVPVVDSDSPVDRAVPQPARVDASTGYAPIVRVRAPGVRIGAWPALVGSGAAAALALQGLFASRFSLPTGPVLGLSLVACLLGLLGARVYYRVEHPRRQGAPAQRGMCIQGFVLAAVGAVVVGALLLGLPVGRLLDVTAPGLMGGMAIGRVGCFLGGCCAGRPTASRWGRWSSDRRLGTRRIPTQLLESALAVLIGSVASAALTVADPVPAGAVFVAAVAAYTFGRQLLFPLRSLPRHTRYGRPLVMLSTGVAFVVAVLIPLV